MRYATEARRQEQEYALMKTQLMTKHVWGQTLPVKIATQTRVVSFVYRGLRMWCTEVVPIKFEAYIKQESC